MYLVVGGVFDILGVCLCIQKNYFTRLLPFVICAVDIFANETFKIDMEEV